MYSARSTADSAAHITVGDILLLLCTVSATVLLPSYSGHGWLPWFASLAFALVALPVALKLIDTVLQSSSNHKQRLTTLTRASSTLCQYLTIPLLTLVYCLGASSTSQPTFWPLAITMSTLLMLYGIQLVTNDDPYDSKTHLLYTVTLSLLACLATIVRAVVYLAFPHHLTQPSQVCFLAIFSVVTTAISCALMTTNTKRIKLTDTLTLPRNELFKLGLTVASGAMFRVLCCLFVGVPVEQKFVIPE